MVFDVAYHMSSICSSALSYSAITPRMLGGVVVVVVGGGPETSHAIASCETGRCRRDRFAQNRGLFAR